ncbi:MAG TPA: hypothetical protein VE954_39965 [Oligoflexus sp.]|uniref:hypothetical protein n=1 Tax=Oligoflexus sp. TaxID=1971216 RepID=UPI002D2448A7|nr:hypothetical protein [Oligoflexus sp.]HYX39319.1 hypothetical protein [Oligoflexus sp.]
MTQKSQDAKEKSGQRPRSERKRYLNIIYFLDSHRTRTLKFSIRTSYLTVATLGLLVSWSLIASLLLIREHGRTSELRNRSRNLLSVIFNYQTRYDQVYEKAYPNDGHPLLSGSGVAARILATAEDQLEDESDQKLEARPDLNIRPAPPTLAAKVAPPSPVAHPSATAPKEKIIAQALETPAANDPSIAVENFSSAVHDETLTIRFSLKNTNKGSKASGTVTAQARFFESGKDGVWLETESASTESQVDTGDQDDPSSDQHFNIRYYKNKVFHFSSPTQGSGLFTAVRVTVKDEQGRSKEFAFPLTKEPRVQQTRLDSETSDANENASTQ